MIGNPNVVVDQELRRRGALCTREWIDSRWRDLVVVRDEYYLEWLLSETADSVESVGSEANP